MLREVNEDDITQVKETLHATLTAFLRRKQRG